MKRFLSIGGAVGTCLFAALLALKLPTPDLSSPKSGSAFVDFMKSNSSKISTQASLDQCILTIEELFTHGCPYGARYRSKRIDADLASVSRIILRPFENKTYMIFAPRGSAVTFRQSIFECDGDKIEMKAPAILSILIDKNIELANADEMTRTISDCNNPTAQD